ncbi:hypothetical protein N24_1320 [Corynebacterium suranareeae]|uniref:Uncharacterized protein n=1 Tax=Corynebacterium suranareeae TaxID=2506452 RepID=A0A169RV26_9CORY|nr:hypothetical protein N24_1320 [Corynebacterium suranareeae]
MASGVDVKPGSLLIKDSFQAGGEFGKSNEYLHGEVGMVQKFDHFASFAAVLERIFAHSFPFGVWADVAKSPTYLSPTCRR